MNKELLHVANVTMSVKIYLNMKSGYIEVEGERVAGTEGTTVENYADVIRGIWDGWKISFVEIQM